LKYTAIQIGKSFQSRGNNERKQNYLDEQRKESNKYELGIESAYPVILNCREKFSFHELSIFSNPINAQNDVKQSEPSSVGGGILLTLQHSPDADNAFKMPQSIQISQSGLSYIVNGQIYSKPLPFASNTLMEKMQMVREQANQHATHSAQSGSLTNLSTLSPSQVIQLLSSGGNQVQSLGSNLYGQRTNHLEETGTPNNPEPLDRIREALFRQDINLRRF